MKVSKKYFASMVNASTRTREYLTDEEGYTTLDLSCSFEVNDGYVNILDDEWPRPEWDIEFGSGTVPADKIIDSVEEKCTDFLYYEVAHEKDGIYKVEAEADVTVTASDVYVREEFEPGYDEVFSEYDYDDADISVDSISFDLIRTI